MNDWWNYLVHSEVGGERKNHKYYARVVVGTDKHGRVQYRYFTMPGSMVRTKPENKTRTKIIKSLAKIRKS